nr:uncharacterized protein LOC118680217 [Bactrocera oleae]
MDIDLILSDTVSTGADRQAMMDPSSISTACSRLLGSIVRMMGGLRRTSASSRTGRSRRCPYPGTVAEQKRYHWSKDKEPQAPGGKQYSNEDVVAARLEDSAGELWLVSAYMPHDDEVEPHPYLLRRALAEARRKGAGVLIASDANSRHTVWGSSDLNERGLADPNTYPKWILAVLTSL